jgi:hypothetical protein
MCAYSDADPEEDRLSGHYSESCEEVLTKKDMKGLIKLLEDSANEFLGPNWRQAT